MLSSIVISTNTMPSSPIKYCWYCGCICREFISICDSCKYEKRYKNKKSN